MKLSFDYHILITNHRFCSLSLSLAGDLWQPRPEVWSDTDEEYRDRDWPGNQRPAPAPRVPASVLSLLLRSSVMITRPPGVPELTRSDLGIIIIIIDDHITIMITRAPFIHPPVSPTCIAGRGSIKKLSSHWYFQALVQTFRFSPSCTILAWAYI